MAVALFGLSSLVEGSVFAITALDPVSWLCVLYLGAGDTFIGLVLYYGGVKDLGVNRAGIFMNLVPVFGTAFSILVLGETLYLTFIVGLVFVVMGVAIINLPDDTFASSGSAV